MRRLYLFLVCLCACNLARAQSIQVVTEEFPPYNYTVDHKVSGVSTDVVRAVLERLKLKTDIVVHSWARAYLMATNEKNVLIYSIGRNKKREKLFHWVGVIAPVKYYLFALSSRDDININTLDQARKYVIGTVIQDVREQYLVSKGFKRTQNIVSTGHYKNNFKMLIKNKIDLWSMSELAAYHVVRQSGYASGIIKKALLLEELANEGYYMAFSLETPDDVVNRFRTALESIKEDGTFQRIHDSYQH